MKLFLVVLAVLVTTVSSKTIREKILANYDKYTRPVTSYKTTTNVSLGIALIRCELGDDGILDTYSWLKVSWKDDLLKWNPSEFEGQDMISIPSDDIWIPDISLYNSADSQQGAIFGSTNVIISSKGDIIWVPPFSASSFCDVDYSHWPFDKQSCIIKFGSWTRDNKQLALQIKMDGKEEGWDLKETTPGTWDITDVSSKLTSTEYPCCPGLEYDDITFTLTLKRNSVFDRVIALIPSIVVSITTLASFWISPKASSNKMIILIADMLITIFVLFNIRGLLPFTTTKIPHVVIFYSLTLLLQTASVIATIVTTNLASKKTPVPAKLRKLHSGILGKLLCIRAQKKSDSTKNEKPATPEDGEEMTNVIGENNVHGKNSVNNHNSVKSDWKLVAIAVDRIFFQWLLGNIVVMYFLYL